MAEQVAESTGDGPLSEPDEGKGSKKLIIIVLAVVILLGGGGGAGYFFMKNSATEADEASAKEKKSKAKTEEASDDGGEDSNTSSKAGNSLRSALPEDDDVTQIIELQPFIVNLADTEQARYLRMTVSLGIASEGKAEEANPLFLTRVRNAMLAILSDKDSSEILSTEGKAKMRKDLLRAAQAAVDEPEIQAIYITDFIVQL